MRTYFFMILLGCLLIINSALAVEKSMVFDGTDRWDCCIYDHNIDADTNPSAVQLLKNELITDEMGNITDATVERISGKIRARKLFLLENPKTEQATLIIYTNSSPGGKFIIEVNGIKNTVTFDPERMLTSAWSRADVDPKQLRKGLNTIDIYAAENNSINLWIDNCRYPNRSAKSVDGGLNWDYNHLGVQDFCDGEYLIRLRLDHYPSKGEILSDFIGVGNLITQDPVKPQFELNTLNVSANISKPRETSVKLFLRGGTSPAFDPETWDNWKSA